MFRKWSLRYTAALLFTGLCVFGTRNTLPMIACLTVGACGPKQCLPSSEQVCALCSGQEVEEVTVDDSCRAQQIVDPSLSILHLAFVVTGDADTTLVDTALRSLFYYRSCPVHFHFVLDEATAGIVWDWLGWFQEVQHSIYLTQYNPQSVLKPSTYETWGTGAVPDGIPYAWSRAVIPSRFAKLSLDAILSAGIDDVLFVDNDVVFLDDVCKAHPVFANMSHTASFGMGPQMSNLYTHV